jgi:predicted cobalt transporter CbtA
MPRIARNFLIIVILALAIDLFATVPAQTAQDALHTGIWDLAGHVTAAATTSIQAPADNLPLLLGAIVLLAALSSSSGGRKRDRW